MADVELVIKIPEELYRAYKDRPPMLGDVGMDMIAQAIANGKPLPKGHGKLCDENQVVASLVWGGFLKDDVKCGDITKILDRATIIEADKGEE